MSSAIVEDQIMIAEVPAQINEYRPRGHWLKDWSQNIRPEGQDVQVIAPAIQSSKNTFRLY
jgi:hypothetical protein